MMVIREHLRQATESAIDLNQRLERIVAIPVRNLKNDNKRGRVDHSRAPWNAQVAHLILELHTTSRAMEDGLRFHLSMSRQPRGGDDENTRYALEAVANLAEAAQDAIVVDLARELGRWCGRAQIALGERDLPKRLPRDVGQTEPRCPYCAHFTLRFWSTQGEVRCVNPECRDESGRRPVAQMDYSPVAQCWVLAWRDGTVGIPTERIAS